MGGHGQLRRRQSIADKCRCQGEVLGGVLGRALGQDLRGPPGAARRGCAGDGRPSRRSADRLFEEYYEARIGDEKAFRKR
jgi:hypothetical protein